jgi:hypothetical protein
MAAVANFHSLFKDYYDDAAQVQYIYEDEQVCYFNLFEVMLLFS